MLNHEFVKILLFLRLLLLLVINDLLDFCSPDLQVHTVELHNEIALHISLLFYFDWVEGRAQIQEVLLEREEEYI
jgi:hypothetical protein